MTYTINVVSVGDWLWSISVVIVDEEGKPILTGSTSVGCETEEEAQIYAEQVFLPDLKRNYDRQIGCLELPPEEVTPDEY